MDAAKTTFGRHRKIMPFEPGAVDDLRRAARINVEPLFDPTGEKMRG